MGYDGGMDGVGMGGVLGRRARYTARLDEALKLSARLHQGQTRRDAAATPYSMHPVAVMCIASSYTDDEDVLVAALLHDVLEDVELPYADKERMIEQAFGARVLDIVRGVSEDKDPLDKAAGTPERSERKRKYVERLRAGSEEALHVSVADKIHNLMSLAAGVELEGPAFWSHFNAPPPEEMAFYAEVLQIAEERHHPAAEELRHWVEKVQKLA